MKIMHYFRNVEFVPEPRTFNTALAAVGKALKMDHVQWLFSTMRTLHRAGGRCTAPYPPPCFKIPPDKDPADRRFLMDKFTLSSVMSALRNTGQKWEAVRTFDEMVYTLRVIPNAHVYNPLIQVCAKQGDFSSVEKYLNEMDNSPHEDCKPTVATYTGLITVFGKAGKAKDMDAALNVLTFMISRGIPPNQATADQLLNSCMDQQNLGLASRVAEILCVKPRKGTWERLIRMFSEANRAVPVVRDLTDDSFCSAVEILRLTATAQPWNLEERISSYMKKHPDSDEKALRYSLNTFSMDLPQQRYPLNCMSCKQEVPTFVLYPCEHLALCNICEKMAPHSCPVCRCRISSVKKVKLCYP